LASLFEAKKFARGMAVLRDEKFRGEVEKSGAAGFRKHTFRWPAKIPFAKSGLCIFEKLGEAAAGGSGAARP
jgi:hypothetical protein